MYSASPHKWLQAPKGSGFLYVRDEVMDRVWSTVTTAGWDDPKIRAERFQTDRWSNVPSLMGLRASIEMANEIGMDENRKPAPRAGELHAGGDDEAWSGVVDFA